MVFKLVWSWDMSVGTVMGYRLDGLGLIPGRARFFSCPQHPDRLWGSTQPSIQWAPGALSPGVKWQGREADHLHLVLRSRMVELYLHSPYVFMAQCLTKHRDNFIFTLLEEYIKFTGILW
jgi:hypothetical protein